MSASVCCIRAVIVVMCLALAPLCAADEQQDVESLLAAGKLEEATKAAQAFARAKPEAVEPHFLLSRVYARQGLCKQAEEEVRTVLFLNPSSVQGHVALADLLCWRGRYKEAQDEYEQALKLDDRYLPAYAGLARLVIATRDPADADLYLRMGLQIAPDSPVLIALQGEAARVGGHPEVAAVRYQQALRADPECGGALYGLAALAQLRGADGEAEAQRLWEQFLTVEPDTERAQRVRLGAVVLAMKALPASGLSDQWPVVSPNGKLLAFAARGDERQQIQVFVAPMDGSAPPRALLTGGDAWCPMWMADSQHVLFDVFYAGGNGKQRTSVVGLEEGAAPVELGGNQEFARHCAPIPGTKRLLYNDAWSLWTMNEDGSDKQKLPVKCVGEVRHTQVSPDGKTALYTCIDWDDKRWNEPPQTIWVAPLDGKGEAREIPTGYNSNWRPTWAPDGKRIAFSTLDAEPQVLVGLADGATTPVRVCRGHRASWAPDGTKVLFDDYARGENLRMVILGGKRLPPVTP